MIAPRWDTLGDKIPFLAVRRNSSSEQLVLKDQIKSMRMLTSSTVHLRYGDRILLAGIALVK